MSADLIIIILLSIFALVAHGAKYHGWLAWLIRSIIIIAFLFEGVSALLFYSGASALENLEGMSQWSFQVTTVLCLLTFALLFLPCRKIISKVLSFIDYLISGQAIIARTKKIGFKAGLAANSIFVPTSIPHLYGGWVFFTVFAYILASINLTSFNLPSIPIPLPVTFDQIFSYNGLGLVLLSCCGVGILVARKPKETLARLGFVKPTGKQVALGVIMIFVTFTFDYLMSLFTHQLPGELGSKISSYNNGAFNAGASAQNAAIIALATGLCAGVGEEALIRGALQPVVGIIPAGLLHGLLHGQFTHAPVLMFHVAAWSIMLGIVRRYTNTTTTMITHVGFNFLSTFLFAFNP